MKTQMQLLEMLRRNAIGNARYYRHYGDWDVVRRHVKSARHLNRVIRYFRTFETLPYAFRTDGTPITRDRLPYESGDDYHWRQVALEESGHLPPTDHVGRPL